MKEESYVRAVPGIQLALNRNRHGISLDLKHLTIRSEEGCSTKQNQAPILTLPLPALTEPIWGLSQPQFPPL